MHVAGRGLIDSKNSVVLKWTCNRSLKETEDKQSFSKNKISRLIPLFCLFVSPLTLIIYIYIYIYIHTCIYLFPPMFPPGCLSLSLFLYFCFFFFFFSLFVFLFFVISLIFSFSLSLSLSIFLSLYGVYIS